MFDNQSCKTAYITLSNLNPDKSFKKIFLSDVEINTLEQFLLKSPSWTYKYARFLKKEPWERGEDIIATSAQYSYFYALYVLGGKRFTKGEHIIAQNGKYAVRYAYDILFERFYAAEDEILRSPDDTFEYAKYVIKGAWYRGEKTIATSAMFSYWYARDILKGEFPLGEKILKTDKIWAQHYANDILKTPWEDAGIRTIEKTEVLQR